MIKFSPAWWCDEEIDCAFKAAIFHNHLQTGDPDFSFEEFLAYSPNNMLNFDVAHYYGATGKHPNELVERLHDRIFSIHLKDKAGKNGTPPNTNMPWGEGDTPH